MDEHELADEDVTPPFAEGTLVAYADYSIPPVFDDAKAKLALTAADPIFSHGHWSYGLHFVQFPERGEPSGGSMWSTHAAKLRLPTSPVEVFAAARYRAAARVIAARAELETAEKEKAAIELAAQMLDRQVAS